MHRTLIAFYTLIKKCELIISDLIVYQIHISENIKKREKEKCVYISCNIFFLRRNRDKLFKLKMVVIDATFLAVAHRKKSLNENDQVSELTKFAAQVATETNKIKIK